MASSAAANGKLEIAERKGTAIPAGWAVDAQGQTSTDPSILRKGGMLLPLGSDSDHGSHKGYGLGAIADILSGVLSGANFGPWVPPFVSFLPLPSDPVGEGIGHFFGAMRIDAFRPADEFKSHMDNWIARFRSAKPVEGQKVLIPGDPEREIEAIRMQEGIPLLASVVNDLQSVATLMGVEW